jgi:hypothetical protein
MHIKSSKLFLVLGGVSIATARTEGLAFVGTDYFGHRGIERQFELACEVSVFVVDAGLVVNGSSQRSTLRQCRYGRAAISLTLRDPLFIAYLSRVPDALES